MRTYTYRLLSILFLLAITVITGCTGTRGFSEYARAGDTISIGAGWAHHMQRGNIEVVITDNAGTETTYTPGQPGYEKVRGSINFYPDPVSGMVLADRLDADITPAARTYAQLINSESTDQDRDWWETVIFVDLPDPMALGDATIQINDIVSPQSESVTSTVTIVPDETGIGTGGTRSTFAARLNEVAPEYRFTVEDSHFQAMERVDHYVVSVSAATVPHAIQVELTHNPDAAHGGTGTPYVINPTGHIKNLSWAQTGISGTDLRVIIMPTSDGEITTVKDFKFYVAGGIGGLSIVDQDTNDPDLDVLAFDSDGAPIAGDVVASVAAN